MVTENSSLIADNYMSSTLCLVGLYYEDVAYIANRLRWKSFVVAELNCNSLVISTINVI